jgi:hypothetical protein
MQADEASELQGQLDALNDTLSKINSRYQRQFQRHEEEHEASLAASRSELDLALARLAEAEKGAAELRGQLERADAAAREGEERLERCENRAWSCKRGREREREGEGRRKRGASPREVQRVEMRLSSDCSHLSLLFPLLPCPSLLPCRLQAINKKLSSEKDDLSAQLKSVSQSLSAMEQTTQQAAKKQQELVNKVRVGHLHQQTPSHSIQFFPLTHI